jgi:hypothetical protein
MSDDRRSLLALVLAVVGLFLCGPVTAIPAFLLVRGLKGTTARVVYWLSIAVCVIWAMVLIGFELLIRSGWSLV